MLREGVRVTDGDELLLLVAEDRLTTGLIGPETGDGKFAALCRDNLNCEKGRTAVSLPLWVKLR